MWFAHGCLGGRGAKYKMSAMVTQGKSLRSRCFCEGLAMNSWCTRTCCSYHSVIASLAPVLFNQLPQRLLLGTRQYSQKLGVSVQMECGRNFDAESLAETCVLLVAVEFQEAHTRRQLRMPLRQLGSDQLARPTPSEPPKTGRVSARAHKESTEYGNYQSV